MVFHSNKIDKRKAIRRRPYGLMAMTKSSGRPEVRIRDETSVRDVKKMWKLINVVGRL